MGFRNIRHNISTIWNHFIHGDTLEIRLEKELIIVAGLLGLGSIAFHRIEGWTYFNALYFCVMTLTGVGYGDVVPVTMLGKSVTMVFSLTALPLYVYTMTIIIEDRLSRLKK